MVFTSTTPWKPRNVNNFKKFEIDKIEFCPYPEFPYAEKKKSPWLRQYQSYISNWYVNGKIFTSTTTWEPKNLIFYFKKVRNWIRLVFWLVLKGWNHSSRSQMHLYVDIGDASSSLWGSTSSLVLGEGENKASVRMQNIITDYHILLPVHFSHFLNCLISYDNNSPYVSWLYNCTRWSENIQWANWMMMHRFI